MVYEIEYIKTGTINDTDKIVLSTNETINFESGPETPHNLTEVIAVFEMIAAKWWGTYETQNAIINIKRIG